jgi:hypothetical protein
VGSQNDAWKALEKFKIPEEISKTCITRIVTHEFPDLDCLFSIYLLRKFGEKYYSGLKDAKLEFIPAGTLYQGKKGIDLIRDGIVTLDIEGGLFDHHNSSIPNNNKQSTVSIIAKELGVSNHRNLRKLIDFINKNDIYGTGIQSRKSVDHLIALPNLLKGLNLIHKPDYNKVYLIVEKMFEAAYILENEFFYAIDDASSGLTFQITKKFKILAFESKSIMSSKAGRYKKAALSIIKGENDSINITSNNRLWPNPDLTKIVKVIRYAEALSGDRSIDKQGIGMIGSLEDWFLHDSKTFISRGSFKKTDTPPSLLSLNEVKDLVIFCFTPDARYLGQFKNCSDIFLNILGGVIKI